MLDLVGDAFRANGLKFQRLDGQLSLHQRKAALESFGSDLECNIMLASIGAAGEGYASGSNSMLSSIHAYSNPIIRIDLTAANSVHIMEPHWNPMAEAQAIDRVHRFGQSREVEVVRYIVNESIENVRALFSQRISLKWWILCSPLHCSMFKRSKNTS